MSFDMYDPHHAIRYNFSVRSEKCFVPAQRCRAWVVITVAPCFVQGRGVRGPGDMAATAKLEPADSVEGNSGSTGALSVTAKIDQRFRAMIAKHGHICHYLRSKWQDRKDEFFKAVQRVVVITVASYVPFF